MTKALNVSLLAGLALCGIAGLNSARAYDRTVTIDNRSDTTIVGFYASNVGDNDWEQDVLGQYVLRPGYHIRVDLADGSGYCRFDFKTVFDDGTSIVRRNVDVCAIDTYTLTE